MLVIPLTAPTFHLARFLDKAGHPEASLQIQKRVSSFMQMTICWNLWLLAVDMIEWCGVVWLKAEGWSRGDDSKRLSHGTWQWGFDPDWLLDERNGKR